MADKTRDYYTNSNTRGGKPVSHGAHVSSMKAVDAKTSHLTQGTGGKVKSAPDQGPKEKTKTMKSSVPLAKKVAGGSNY